MHVTQTPIERIIPYARNPRCNDLAVAKVAASIKEFGWRQPIVVDEQMVVIAGHTRLLAARQLGYTSVPIHIATGLTDAQVKAYRLADNRTHEDAKWDNDLLKIELGDLKDLDFDLGLTGFEDAELEELLVHTGAIGLTDEDDIPEEVAAPTSRLGDIWLLGKHKLLCGDALDAESYTKLLDAPAYMAFTDPPYNVNYGGSCADKAAAKISGVSKHKILNDNLQEGFYEFLHAASKHLIANCNGAIYISMAGSELDTLHRAFVQAGGHWSTFIIWAKNHSTIGLSDYHRQHEPILYGWPKGRKHFWCGARDQTDLWFFNKPNVSDLHPTMKPVELVQRAIENSSKPNEIVLDAFAGSGSTLIACEKTNRACRAIELEPKYCDVIVQRWQEYTGKEAILASTQKTFAEVNEALAELKSLSLKQQECNSNH